MTNSTAELHLAPGIYENQGDFLSHHPGAGKYLDQFTELDPFAVFKVGGAIADDPEQLQQTARAMVQLQALGLRAVLFHGGGNQIDRKLNEAGYRTVKRDGIRITPPEHMDAVAAGLEEANEAILDAVREEGGEAVGISDIFTARWRDPNNATSHEIVEVDTSDIRAATAEDVLPVVSCIGHASLRDTVDFQPVNINADVSATALAIHLPVRKYVSLTDVGAIRDGDRKLDNVTATQIDELIYKGIITEGMLPKVREAVRLLDNGIHDVVFTKPRALLRELFSDEGAGTIVHVED